MNLSKSLKTILGLSCLVGFLFTSYSWFYYCLPSESLKFALSFAWASEKFSIENAGMALDKPSIGKYILWSSRIMFFGCMCIYMLKSVISSENKLANYIMKNMTYFFAAYILINFLMPLCLTLQYIISMGFTSRRIAGLILCMLCYLVFPLFIYRVNRLANCEKSIWKNEAHWALALSLIAPAYYVFA